MTEYRAMFDASMTFLNGGGLRVEAFRVDVPRRDTSEDEIVALFISSLNLLMVEHVSLTKLQIIEEPHKGTHAGPSDHSPRGESGQWGRLVDLSHLITEGMTTMPGLPVPHITPHLTREASRQVYAAGTEFTIDVITMGGNTGTYVDSPFHRYSDGTDLAGVPLARLANLPAVLARTAGSATRAVDVAALAGLEVAGAAVLLHTGADRHWGTPAYYEDAPFLTEAGAEWLAAQGAALVGIDSANIDEMTPGGPRPAHSVLLAAGIPIVEHLTGLDQLPPTGARFTAAPPRVADFGTFPVRAFAVLPPN
ncbi:cyclase family protein [Jatrophihabitans sp. DSM 45814]